MISLMIMSCENAEKAAVNNRQPSQRMVLNVIPVGLSVKSKSARPWAVNSSTESLDSEVRSTREYPRQRLPRLPCDAPAFQSLDLARLASIGFARALSAFAM